MRQHPFGVQGQRPGAGVQGAGGGPLQSMPACSTQGTGAQLPPNEANRVRRARSPRMSNIPGLSGYRQPLLQKAQHSRLVGVQAILWLAQILGALRQRRHQRAVDVGIEHRWVDIALAADRRRVA
jgi:hypothetical protein